MKRVPAKEVYDFWFDEKNKAYWFEQNEEFNREIRRLRILPLLGQLRVQYRLIFVFYS